MSTDQQQQARHFYDRIAGVYDGLSDASEKAAREKGLALLNVAEGERVLEIGYGTGHDLVELARAAGSSGRVCGVDVSPGMRDVAREHLEQAGLADQVDLQVAGVPPIPYDDSSFDAVTASFTLELFPLDVVPQVLAEVRRVLVPGGRLGIVSMSTVPEGEHESVLEKTYKWMHQHFPHIVDCQPIDAAGLLQEAGFDVTAREDMQIWTLAVVALVGVAKS